MGKWMMRGCNASQFGIGGNCGMANLLADTDEFAAGQAGELELTLKILFRTSLQE